MGRFLVEILTYCALTSSAALAVAQHKVELGGHSGVRAVEQGVDELAWLGPLPEKLTPENLHSRLVAALEKANNDMRSDDDLKKFVCKRPEEVGPVPQMGAVDAWLNAWPDGKKNDALVKGLYRAAAAGNWLARAQLYGVLSERDDESPVRKYRWVQLVEWLQRQQLGQLYAMMGYETESSGYWSDQPGNPISRFDVSAALHHSYPAQNKVGRALADSADPALSAIGRQMLGCASGSMPAYARLFSGETQRRHKQREQARADTAITPLMRAVQRGDVDMVERELAQPEAAPNARTLDGETALSFALQAKLLQPKIIEALIKHGAKVRGHGPVGKYPFNHVGLLNLAVKAADIEVFRMLVQGGAEAFKIDEVNTEISSTAFGETIDAYQTKPGRAMFDWLLTTAKLAPRSTLATQFADYAAAKQPAAFARLLDYGAVPSIEAVNAIFREHIDDQIGAGGRLDDVAELLRRYPALANELKGDTGYGVLVEVVWHCNFEPATYLVGLGAPLVSKRRVVPTALISAAQRCKLAEPGRKQARLRWLQALARRGYDFNMEGPSHCPVWMTDRRGSCQLPDDDDQIRDLLSLGVDPFRFYPSQPGSAVMFALANCRAPIVEMFLEKFHGRSDGDARKGLREMRDGASDSRVCDEIRDGVGARLRSQPRT